MNKSLQKRLRLTSGTCETPGKLTGKLPGLTIISCCLLMTVTPGQGQNERTRLVHNLHKSGPLHAQQRSVKTMEDLKLEIEVLEERIAPSSNGSNSYEGQPGNQGNGSHGYEGQPGNQGG